MRYVNVSQMQGCNFFVTDERLLARELCLSHYGILFPICKLLYYCWAYDFCFLAYSAFPRSYFVCLWSAMRYVQKNLFFSLATFLTDKGLMTRVV